jgi:hypothetical protein
MSKPVEPCRWSYTKVDKFGKPLDPTFYYPLSPHQTRFLHMILKDFPDEEFFNIISENDIRTILRTRDYSEIHQEKLIQLRKLYIQNSYA